MFNCTPTLTNVRAQRSDGKAEGKSVHRGILEVFTCFIEQITLFSIGERRLITGIRRFKGFPCGGGGGGGGTKM